MAGINMASILNKAKKHMKSVDGQKKIERAVDHKVRSNEWDIGMAAEDFIDVMKNEINSHAENSGGGGYSEGKLGATAINVLTKLDHDAPEKVKRNTYAIDVYFTEDLHRESLAPDRYPGVDNIAALLNSGYAAGNAVYGIWRGHGNDRIKSLERRAGAHFIENAIRNYMASYAKQHSVIDILKDEIYD